MSDDGPLRAGVVGVGEMGRHHARVYDGLGDVTLAGVADQDPDRASEVARRYGAVATDEATLFDEADLVSVAVPTDYHYEVAGRAIDAGTPVLVEKPFVRDPEKGRELVRRARRAGVTITVGHVERYNPAVRALGAVVTDLDLIGVQARRLGPPVDENRGVDDGVWFDLMVHDIDVIRALVARVGGDADAVQVVDADGAENGHYASALVDFDGVVGSLVASRLTQRKVRDLFLTARDCCVTLDYTERSVRIHRQSLPSYVADDEGLQYRHESVTERPTVENGEPLARELEAFAAAVRDGQDPPVTGMDGVRAVELARQVARAARGRRQEVTV